MPTTTSLVVGAKSLRSARAISALSSAFSTDRRKAFSPPAMYPLTIPWSTPKVGQHSEASRTPMRPDVPAPK